MNNLLNHPLSSFDTLLIETLSSLNKKGWNVHLPSTTAGIIQVDPEEKTILINSTVDLTVKQYSLIRESVKLDSGITLRKGYDIDEVDKKVVSILSSTDFNFTKLVSFQLFSSIAQLLDKNHPAQKTMYVHNYKMKGR